MRVLIVFAGIAILFFALTMGKTTTKNPDVQVACVNDPDPKHIAIYNEAIYRRIRADTPIFYKEIPVHFAPTTPFEIYVDGKFRKAYVPWFDGELDNKYVNWRPLTGVDNLMFVDKTDERAIAESGFHYYDVYLKPNNKGQYIVPVFISDYCLAAYPVANQTMYPNSDGTFIPPAAFNTDKITNWEDGTGNPVSTTRPPANTLFYIVQYEDIESPTGKISTNAIFARGDLTLTLGSVTKNYKVYWVPAVMNYLALVDKDTSLPDAKLVYKYTLASADFQPTFATSGSNTGPKPNLQLETFNYPILHAFGWWTPECKPAIYLYPKKKTDVHVTVDPAGYLTYTDPLYPAGGWRVTAHPDGTIASGENTYPYLYYESAIRDDAFAKPARGYVVAYEELPTLFTVLLPKLGLSAKETNEFKAYWEPILPESRYYFVGVMEDKIIDAIEPMKISPSPDTIIRVRLYFEALDTVKPVAAPVIITPKREGFVVAEWGGLVKTDPSHPFTCSQ